MRKKIAFIGAGSVTFTRNLVRDILSYPSLNNSIITLMDIDSERLQYSRNIVKELIKAGGYPAKVYATMDRKEAVQDADGVIITILSGDISIWRKDIEIPKKYGVDICIGDTRGPAGVFRFLRTAPDMTEIIRDIEKLAPNALVLNYTNPMAMLCRLLQAESQVRITGLCHSVQHTADMLSKWLGVEDKKISYLCAGINHQSFFLEFYADGEEMTEKIREVSMSPKYYKKDIVRNELCKYLKYYPTESSGHSSEYLPWFRKREDLLRQYCEIEDSEDWNPGKYAKSIEYYEQQKENWKTEIEQWLKNPKKNLCRGDEYAAGIFNAFFGDGEEFRFNGNIRNFGIIDNLPWGCCVETPVVASKNKLEYIRVGMIPPQTALINSINAQCEELAVQGYQEKDREKIFYSICYDPLTAARLSLKEIREMFDEMFSANREFIKW